MLNLSSSNLFMQLALVLTSKKCIATNYLQNLSYIIVIWYITRVQEIKDKSVLVLI